MHPNVALLVIGALCILVAIFTGRGSDKKAARCTVSTPGVVKDIRESYDSDDGRTTYYPIFEYKIGSQTFTQSSSIGSSKRQFNPNDSVTIMYNPDKPNEFMVQGYSEKASKGVSKIFIFMGILFLALGFFIGE